MKLLIQLPEIELDLPDDSFENKEAAVRVGKEFLNWLRRFLPTWGWRKFIKSKYPDFMDSTSISFKEKTSDVWTQLKPHSGEQLSDLLRTVAEVSPRQAVALEFVLNQSNEKQQLLTSILNYCSKEEHTKRSLIKFLSGALDNPQLYGYSWSGDRLTKTSVRSDKLVLALDDANRAAWIGQVQELDKKTSTVKFLSGHLNTPSSVIAIENKRLVNVGDELMFDHDLNDFDEDYLVRVKTIVKTKVIVDQIDAKLGIFVKSKNVRQWVSLNNLQTLSRKQ